MKNLKEVERLKSASDGCNDSNNDSVFINEKININQCLEEIQQLQNFDEWKSIIEKITPEHPVSDTLLMGKFLIFLVENILPWQKPIGQYFQSSYVICSAKPRKLYEQESTVANTFCDDSVNGNPMLVQFESLISPKLEKVNFPTLMQRLKMMYNVYPLPHSIGKQLIFTCSKLKNSFKFPFITICHGKPSGSIILYGVSVKEKTFRLKIQNQGKVCSLENLPSVASLKSVHSEGLPPSLVNENSINTNVSATYQFLPFDDNSNLMPVKTANLSVQCSWSDAEALLEPLPTECTCIAKLNAIAGDEDSGAFVKYKEIKLLKALQESLSSHMMSWINTTPLDLILEKINELVTDVRNRIYSRECHKETEMDENSFEDLIVKERLLLSLPDQLWLIMKNCSSFENLVEVIKYTYKAFATLSFTFPAAHINDMSTISKDIISMFDKSVSCPVLDEKKAAEMLLEIGIEKMRRDYYEFFISLGLVPQDLFNHFTHSALLCSDAVTGLEKLHSVLELTLVCKKQLKLPESNLKQFARNALKYYMSVPEIDVQHVFTFHIPTFDIRTVLNMMRPINWELSLKSEDKSCMKQSCHHLVTTTTHDHIYAPQNYHPMLMLKKASYAYSTGTLIEDNVSPYFS